MPVFLLLILVPAGTPEGRGTARKSDHDLVIFVRAEECREGALRDAEIHILADGNWLGPYPPKTNGRVVIKNLPSGVVTVQVIAPGCKTFGKRYQLTDPQEEITVRLEKPG